MAYPDPGPTPGTDSRDPPGRTGAAARQLRPRRVVLVLAAAVAALGLLVLVGTFAGSRAVAQLRPDLPPMQGNTAVAFVLAGLGLAALLHERRRAAAALGVAVAAIGGLTFGQYLFRADVGIDRLLVAHPFITLTSSPGRMSPETGLALVLAGLALASFHKGPAVPGFLGTLVLTVGTAWLLGYAFALTSALGSRTYGHMAVHSAAGLVLLGGALLLLAFSDPRWPRARSPWLPFLTGALVTLATLVLWRALDVRSTVQVEEVVRTTTRGVVREVEERLQLMTGALRNLRDYGRDVRWRSTGDWKSHARLTLGAFPSFELIHWIDAEADRRAVFGDPQWREGEAERLIASPLFVTAVARAEDAQEPVFVGPFASDRGPLFQIVFAPPEPWDGYLAAAFSAKRAFGALAQSIAPGYRIAIATDAGEVFSDGPRLSGDAEAWGTSTRLALPGSGAWTVRVTPGPRVLAGQRSALPEVVLGAGLMIGLLLTSALRYGELAAARADELEAMVRQRTYELEGALAQVRDENRERRRTEAALRRFLITLGHELRNPLGSIVTALEVLDIEPDDGPKSRQMHHIVRRQVAHLGRLVEDLLDISRIEQGKVALLPERLDLAALIREVADSNGAGIAAAGVELEADLPPEPVWVDADGTRLVQVIGNLLSNSMKFTDPGGRITLSLGRAGGEAVISVRDTGCGLEPEEIGRVLEPFAQLDEAQRRMSGGLGLGLAIVKGLVEAHGGRLEVTSDGPGCGTEVTVRLPEAAVPDEREPAPRPAARPAEARVPLRILLIDDHHDSADGLAELLRIQGHEVEVAYDGVRGIEMAVASEPDVVISDLGLPGLDGFGVAQALRAEGATRDLRLVALSGYGDRASIERAREAGFDRHLSKPVDPAALRAALAEVPAPGGGAG